MTGNGPISPEQIMATVFWLAAFCIYPPHLIGIAVDRWSLFGGYAPVVVASGGAAITLQTIAISNSREGAA